MPATKRRSAKHSRQQMWQHEHNRLQGCHRMAIANLQAIANSLTVEPAVRNRTKQALKIIEELEYCARLKRRQPLPEITNES